jgi:hypothetical protein
VEWWCCGWECCIYRGFATFLSSIQPLLRPTISFQERGAINSPFSNDWLAEESLYWLADEFLSEAITRRMHTSSGNHHSQ